MDRAEGLAVCWISVELCFSQVALLSREYSLRSSFEAGYTAIGRHLLTSPSRGGARGTVIALLEELEQLTAQVVAVVQEAQRPVVDSIAQEVGKRVPTIPEEAARMVADAIIARAGELCFPNWFAQQYMDTELFRELTVLLATTFRDLNLHGPGEDFVDRCIRLLKKVRFVGVAEL